MKVGFVGLGRWSYVLGSAVARSALMTVSACYSRTKENRERFVERFGCAACETLETMLERSDIDGIIVTAPNDKHEGLVKAVVARKKHVFVEKPIAHSLEAALRIKDAVASSGITFACGHGPRYLKGIQAIKKRIVAGDIGTPTQVDALFANNHGARVAHDIGNWRADETSVPGGVLTQIGIHHVDNVNMLFGLPKRVSCVGAKVGGLGVEGIAAVTLDWCDGRIGAINTNWFAPGKFALRVLGTKGGFEYELPLEYWGQPEVADNKAMLWYETEESGRRRVRLGGGDYLKEELEIWAKACMGSGSVDVGVDVSIGNLKVVLAAVESMRKECFVSIV